MTAPAAAAGVPHGKAAAAALTARLRERLEPLAALRPRLALVSVGDLDPGTESYIAAKQRHAAALGVAADHVRLPAGLPAGQVAERVAAVVADPAVHAVLVQLPVPDHLDPRGLANLVALDKDVDGLSDASLGRLAAGRPVHPPATPLGVLRLLEHYQVELAGRHAVVVGRSTLVGMGQALLLLLRGVDATVTVCHSRTPDLAAFTSTADVLVSAAGVPGLITGAHVRPGAVVLDVGLTRTAEGIRGDVLAAEVSRVASALTPMPGGTGPMTVAALMENVTRAVELAAGQGR